MGEATINNCSPESAAKNPELTGYKTIESSSKESDLSDSLGLTENQKRMREKLLSILDEIKESFRTYHMILFENRLERGGRTNSEYIQYLKSFLDAENSEDIKIVLNFSQENGMAILHDVAEFYNVITELILCSGAHPIVQVTKSYHVAGFYHLITEFLLGSGADPNVQDTKGKTPLHYATKINLFESIEMLLNAGADHDMPDNDGKTPLQMAIDCNKYDCVGLFLDNKHKKLPDKQKKLDKELYELLYDKEYNIDNGSINDSIADLKKFLDRNKKENSKDLEFLLNLPRGRFGSTLLHNAQSLFCHQTLNLLLDAGADLNIQDIDGNTPLHIAVRYGYQDTVQLLLKAGADPNIKNMDGDTPFRVGIVNEWLNIVQLFLENSRTDVNLKHEITGESPIFDAVETNASGGNITDSMIKSGKIDLSIRNKKGVTVLHRAAFVGQRGTIQLLLEQGASASDVDYEGNNPLRYIIYNNHKFYGADSEDERREFDYDDNGENIIAGIIAFVSFHVKDLTELINEKMVEYHQETDIEACIQLQREICNLALKREAKVKEYINTKNRNDNTPLFFAIESGRRDVVKTLLERGAEVNVTDKNCHTTFHYAVKSKDPEILKLLVSSLIDSEITQEKIEDAINVPSQIYFLPLYYMASSIKDKILNPILLDHSLSTKDIDERIEAILADFIRENKEFCNSADELSKIITSAIEETHARINVRDKDGNTLLHHAVKWGCSEEILDFIVEGGVDVNEKNNNGVAAIHIAAKYGTLSQMQWFKECGADLNLQCVNFMNSDIDNIGKEFPKDSKIHDKFSQMSNYINVNDDNVDISSTSYQNATPIFIAADNLNTGVVHMLTSQGAKSNIPNNVGATPLQVVAARILNRDYEERKMGDIYPIFEVLALFSTDNLSHCKNLIEILGGDEQVKKKAQYIA